MSTAARCTGAILAGGRASRFGGASKGLEIVGGARIIDRVAAALRDACDEIVIVANDAAAAQWIPSVRVVPDVRPGSAALGGIHAALVHSGGPVLVASWDTPFISATLVTALRDTGETQRADAALARSRSPWGFEPLCAWYAPSCLPIIEQRIDAGDLRAGAWQGSVSCAFVDASRWGNPDEIFLSVNSPQDLAAANSIVSKRP